MAIDTNISIITLIAAKSYLDIDSSDTDFDAELENFVNSVSQYMNTYTDRNLKEKTFTEYYDGDNSDTIFTKNYPIASSTASVDIYIDTDRSYGSDTKVTSTNIVIYSDDGKIVLDGDIFTYSPQSTKIIYTAGYSAASMPEDLQLVCKKIIAKLWEERQRGSEGKTTISIANGSSTYDIDKAIPEWCRQILNKYKRIVIW